MKRWQNFKRFLNETFIWNTNVVLAYNVKTLGEEAGLEAQIFSLAQMPIGSTNVKFSTKPAFLPNVCYAFVLFHK